MCVCLWGVGVVGWLCVVGWLVSVGVWCVCGVGVGWLVFIDDCFVVLDDERFLFDVRVFVFCVVVCMFVWCVVGYWCVVCGYKWL